jgi:molybdopterin synthase sulfur carrier subunit
MSITVQIPTALRKLTDGAQCIDFTGVKSLSDLLDQLGEKFPQISRHLRDDRGALRRFVNVYVNDEDIRFLGGANYLFKEGDVILLVPSIAGGVFPRAARSQKNARRKSIPAHSRGAFRKQKFNGE